MRLFVGIPVPESPVYEQVTRELAQVADAKPVPAASWHVTLRFLGDMEDPEPVVSALDGAVADAAPIPGTVQGVGAFQDPRRARIVWAGVDAPGVEKLAAAVQEVTADLGKAEEKREFRPHVTLARLRRPQDISSFVARHESTLFAAGVMDRVVLYRSRLGPEGSHYERLREWPLP